MPPLHRTAILQQGRPGLPSLVNGKHLDGEAGETANILEAKSGMKGLGSEGVIGFLQLYQVTVSVAGIISQPGEQDGVIGAKLGVIHVSQIVWSTRHSISHIDVDSL